MTTRQWRDFSAEGPGVGSAAGALQGLEKPGGDDLGLDGGEALPAIPAARVTMYAIPGCAALAGALSGETRKWMEATRNWSVLSWTMLSR